MLLFVPAIAACALVGWWAGGRAFLAIAWVAIAVVLIGATAGHDRTRSTIWLRGWSLLARRRVRARLPVRHRRGRSSPARSSRSAMALVLAPVMSLLGPVTMSRRRRRSSATSSRVATARSMATLNSGDQAHPKEWQRSRRRRFPPFAQLPTETRTAARRRCRDVGRDDLPALLALRVARRARARVGDVSPARRARLGAPLQPLREFRFNDQLVWGLIVGSTIMLLPTLDALRGVGQNLARLFRRAVRRARPRRAVLVHGARQPRRRRSPSASCMLFAPVAQRVRRARAS